MSITKGLENPDILLNGKGNITRFNHSTKAVLPLPTPYTLNFEPAKPKQRAKRYLLRLINTSFESTFIFSIDNHQLLVVGADFVPIHPYPKDHVLIGIGQRYHIIVEANPQAGSENPLPSDGNFWIRTWRGDCFVFAKPDAGHEKAGILRYDSYLTATPTTTQWPNVSTVCADEPYESLKPIVPWTIGRPANAAPGTIGENLSVIFDQDPDYFPLAKFSLGGDDFNPLRIDYSDPIFLRLNYTGEWDPLWVVYPENYTDDSWVCLL